MVCSNFIKICYNIKKIDITKQTGYTNFTMPGLDVVSYFE